MLSRYLGPLRFAPSGPENLGGSVARLLAGNGVAQVVPVLAMPLLTRVYSPSDFGPLAVFMSIAQICASVASARMDIALVLPRSQLRAAALALAGLAASSVLALALCATLLVSANSVVISLSLGVGARWLWLLPWAMLSISSFNLAVALANRDRRYSSSARAAATRSIAMVASQLLAGAMGLGAQGLILGFTISCFLGQVSLWRPYMADLSRVRRRGANYLLAVAWRARKFTLLSTPSALVNSLAINAVVLLMSRQYPASVIGVYSIVQRLLGAPTALLGNAVAQVFFREIADMGHRKVSIAPFFRRSERLLLLPSVIAFGVAAALAPPAIQLALGDGWLSAAPMVILLAPMFAMRFVASALSHTTSALDAQGMFLLWQLGLLAVAASTWLGAPVLGASFEQTLAVYSALTGAHYAVLLYLMYRKAVVSRGVSLATLH